jgi:hypothetical protein
MAGRNGSPRAPENRGGGNNQGSNRSTQNPTVLPDEPNPDAAAVEAAFEPGHDPRGFRYPGRTATAARIEEYTYRRKVELWRQAEREAGVPRGALPEQTYDELAAQATAEVEAEPPVLPHDQKVADEWEMTSRVEDEPPEKLEPLVINAVLRLRHVLWFLFRLAGRTGGRGPAPARKLGAASILHMAFKRGRPEVWETRNCFRGSNALLHWAYRCPKHNEAADLERTSFYEAVHLVFDQTNLDPYLVEHLQVETFKQFATQIVGRDRKGRPILRHSKAGVALVCDGSFTEGQAQQGVILDEEHRQIRIRHRADRDGIRLRVYAADGHFRAKVVGYKLVVLVCLTTARPVISALVPADAHEPDVVTYLLERLFELWPDAPVEFLVGDALYGHGRDFLRELMFRFGIDPVFPWRADYPADATDENGVATQIKGVPVCRCAGTPRPMRFLQRKGKWWGPRQRAKGDLPRGQWAPLADHRIRYEFCCPDADARGKNGGCKAKYTYPWDEPRTNTYLPHAGDCERASMRRVFLWQRNVVESCYAALQRLGLQQRGVERPAWANDVENSWLLGLGLMFLTARRFAYESGLYESAYDEAERLHLLDNPTRDTLAPGPTRAELEAADAEQARELGPIHPPASWMRERGDIEPLTGSGANWAAECGVELLARALADDPEAELGESEDDADEVAADEAGEAAA